MASSEHIKWLFEVAEDGNRRQEREAPSTPDFADESIQDIFTRAGKYDGSGLIDLARINLKGANLRGTRFGRTDLSNANLRDADLRGATFECSKLDHVKFFNADLKGADLSGATSIAGAEFAFSKSQTEGEQCKKQPLHSILYPKDESLQRLEGAIEPIESVGGLLGMIKRIKKHHETYPEEIFLYFRGESKCGRALIPSVMRQDEFRGNEAKLLRELISRRPEEFSRETSALSQWVLAQHHDLPTRFLDVTRNPLVALFNACKSNRQKSGRLYIFAVPESLVKPFSSDTVSIIANMANLNTCEQDVLLGRKGGSEDEYAIAKLRLYQGIKAEKPYFEERIEVTDLYKVFVIEPKQFSERIRAQSGAFLASAYHQRFERCEIRSKNCRIPIYADYKLHVPVGKKCSIMAELGLLNISDEALSPGLDASAKAVTKQFRRQQQTRTDGSCTDKRKTSPFQKHERVVLTTEVLGDDGTELRLGDAGTIVQVHPGDEAFVVKFMALDGDTVAVATVSPSQIRPVASTDLAHARSVEAIG